MWIIFMILLFALLFTQIIKNILQIINSIEQRLARYNITKAYELGMKGAEKNDGI